MDDLVLFAGPTLDDARRIHGDDLPLVGVEIRPPVRRGDLPALVGSRGPGTCAIVDGEFHQTLSVGHVEIRDAIESGWTVWGLASMGAIRAREMHHLGMRGFGRVFETFCDSDTDVRDDEVTLLYTPDSPPRSLSEPLMHLRRALADFVDRDVLTASNADQIASELAGLYFGDRTLQHFEMMLRRRQSGPWSEAIAAFDQYRIKALDLIDFLCSR